MMAYDEMGNYTGYDDSYSQPVSPYDFEEEDRKKELPLVENKKTEIPSVEVKTETKVINVKNTDAPKIENKFLLHIVQSTDFVNFRIILSISIF
jgi:hypothetical protein